MRKWLRIEEHMWWYRALHRSLLLVFERFLPTRATRLLDAGCGTGGLLRVLGAVPFPHRVFGLYNSATTIGRLVGELTALRPRTATRLYSSTTGVGTMRGICRELVQSSPVPVVRSDE